MHHRFVVLNWDYDLELEKELQQEEQSVLLVT